MTSTPPPPPGWKPQPVVPVSQQQAQDTIIGYLRRTLQELPTGTTLDATRYSGGTNTVPCKDDAGNPPEEFTTIGDLKPPSGTDVNALVASVGDIWKRWGWHVFEREGFYKPNRFGYAPDGYSLQIEARARPGEPPSLKATSPCFPAAITRDRTPFPAILTAE